jgi:hypothetical protein
MDAPVDAFGACDARLLGRGAVEVREVGATLLSGEAVRADGGLGVVRADGGLGIAPVAAAPGASGATRCRRALGGGGGVAVALGREVGSGGCVGDSSR